MLWAYVFAVAGTLLLVLALRSWMLQRRRTMPELETKQYSGHVTVSRLSVNTAGEAGMAIKEATEDRKTRKPSDAGDRAITIVFLTQSGTADGFAKNLSREAQSLGLNAEKCDIEEYDYKNKLQNEQLVVFYAATYGEGDPPDTAIEFFEWFFDEERPEDLLRDVVFAVFGLGNRQYEYFCQTGKKLDKRLAELGGRRLVPLGLGDDDGSIEEDNDEWKVKLWDNVRQYFKIEGRDQRNSISLTFKPDFRIVLHGQRGAAEGVTVISFDDHLAFIGSKHQRYSIGVVANNDELRIDDPGVSTRHIEVTTPVNVEYRTADNLGILPHNHLNDVEKVAMRLGIALETVFELKPLRNENEQIIRPPVKTPCTVKDALMWYCDISTPPTRNFLQFLAQYTTDKLEKKDLSDMADSQSQDGKSKYHGHFVQDKKTLLEMLEEFPSCSPPFEHLLQECPPLQPRMYTIASSSLSNPKQIDLAVSVSEVKKSRGRIFRGVCSTFLKNLKPGDSLPMFVQKSTFSLPENLKNPVIMIAAGTGIAPFRAFLLEGLWHIENQQEAISSWALFFGCRNEAVDYLYRDLIETAHKKGLLTLVKTAFSRDGLKKCYVQDRVAENSLQIFNMIQQQQASIYVCGSAAMGTAVREELKRIFKTHGNLDDYAAADLLRKLQQDHRYIQELWG